MQKANFVYFLPAKFIIALTATIIAAGAANIAMLATMAFIRVPRPGITFNGKNVPAVPLTLAPRLATTKATVATKKDVVSF